MLLGVVVCLVVAVLLLVLVPREEPAVEPSATPTPERVADVPVAVPYTPVTGIETGKATGVSVGERASLTVYSNPDGADVYLDGRPMAASPCTIRDIPVRASAQVEVRHEGYKPFRQKIALRAGKTTRLTAPLEPLVTLLRVVTVPAKAMVSVDGRALGPSPVTLRDRQGGRYTIRAELAGYDAAERAVEIAQYEERTETITLVRNLGVVTVTMGTPDVTVTVGGRDVAVSERGADGTVVARVENLEPGIHEVVLSKPGFHSKTYTVNVGRGRELNLKCDLEPVMTADYEVIATDGTIYRGRLVRVTADGTVRLEIGPGRFRNIPASVIASSRELEP
jgi:hypothetical protein